MADLVYTDLLNVKTADEIELEINNTLTDSGLPVSSWKKSSVQVVLIEAVSAVLADLYASRSLIAQGGNLETSYGDWLTLLAFAQYQIQRVPAEFTQGSITLLDNASAGPYTISPGQLWISSPNGHRYNNLDGGTLDKNGDLALTFRAESSGTAYNNVSINSDWTFLTPIAGVGVSNPEVASSGTWITVSGRDVESDASLKERCRDKWPTQGMGLTAEAWEYWARQANAEVTRVMVISNPGGVPGLTGIIIAGQTGEFTLDADSNLTPDVVEDVNVQLQEIKTTTTILTVESAVNRSLPIIGVVYVASAFVSEVTASIPTVLGEYQQSLEIGSPVYISPIICAIQDLPGVRNVVLTNGSTTALEYNQVPILDLTLLTVQAV